MGMDKLNLAPNLSLPAEAVTQTFAILAKRGMGKTYTASVMAEEMLKAKSHVIIIDPVGVWWGLRSSADGKGDGLPIIIAGGEHADIPLQPGGGELLADLVVDKRISIVIDLSLMRKGQQVKFMTDFAETLYRRNRNAVHLILDEADAFAPQRPMPGEAQMLGAIEDIVRRGRARGIGVTMITQRPSVLNKNVLTQIEVLIALRLTAPLDQKAVDEWVKTHAEEGQRQEFMASLPSLPVGTAWFWSPGWLNLFERVKVRKRETMDSSSTPKIGQPVKAAKLAPVDIEALREQMAETIEAAEATDPKALQRRVKELEQQLANQKPQEPTTIVTQVEVLPKGWQKDISILAEELQAYVERFNGLVGRAKGYSEANDTISQFSEADTRRISEMPDVAPVMYGNNGKVMIATDYTPDDTKLSKAANALLNVLAQHPTGRTKIQLSILSGYSKKSSSFSNALGELRTRGFISAAGIEPILATPAGAAIAENDPLPTGIALFNYWCGKLDKAAATFLNSLYAAYPESLNYDELQTRTGYSRTSSSFSNALGKLRSLELISRSNPVQVSQIFFEGES